jgi:rubrerythrin
LEDRGIRTQVVGETLRTAAGDLPLGQTLAPRIWVREGDARRAREIIEECASQSHQESDEFAEDDEQAEDVTFPCQRCGRSIAFPAQRRGHVETCPNCGHYVDVPD